MKFNKKILTFLSLFILLLNPLLGKEDHTIEDQPLAWELLVALPQEGVLRAKDNGFVYLDVSNAFITDILSVLDHPGLLRPGPTSSRSVGAHISVFYEGEEIAPSELGESFSFSVKEIRSFTNHTKDGSKKLWVIAVDAPELEALREQYGCESKLKGHEFHISLGKQMPSAAEGWEEIEDLSLLNFHDDETVGLFESGDYVSVDMTEVQDHIDAIEKIGQLRLKSNGFVFVDVADAFIEDLMWQLPVQGTFEPLSTGSRKMGAHISTIHEDEMIKNGIWNLEEAGEWFTFEVKELRYVDRKTSSGTQRLWLLAVDAPGLERLRTQYGLKPKLLGHDFHITLGYEQISAPLPSCGTEKSSEILQLAPAA